jgi:hypothetical protein
VRQTPLRPVFAGQNIPFLPIAEMALILLRMACGEAEVERVFARLRYRLGDDVQHMQDDLIESRLTIIMNIRDVTPDFLRDFAQMEHDVLEAPPRH